MEKVYKEYLDKYLNGADQLATPNSTTLTTLTAAQQSLMQQYQQTAQQQIQQQILQQQQPSSGSWVGTATTAVAPSGIASVDLDPHLTDYKVLIVLALVMAYGPEMTKRVIRKFASKQFIQDAQIDELAKTLAKMEEDPDDNLQNVINECAKEIKI
jgi:hypothetical protein